MPKCGVDNDMAKCGYYPNLASTIYVNLRECKLTSRFRDPGMIKDHTIIGVLAHELGHYLQQTQFPAIRGRFRRLSEPMIHYFERNIDEDIAESIRLYILNPSLLRDGRPKRHAILSDYFRTSTADPWVLILRNSFPCQKALLRRWIDGEI